jgi:YVTN family beta-propeller protein
MFNNIGSSWSSRRLGSILSWQLQTANNMTLFFLFFLISSCKPKETEPLLNINYPAGYVVNGESNSVSVIDLRDNQVKETIELGIRSSKNQTNTVNTFWSHHIYSSNDKTKLAIATPQIDYTLGHDAVHQASSTKSGGITVLNAKTGQILLEIFVPRINYNAIFVNNDKEIWTTTTTHSGEVLVFDAENGKQLNTISIGADPSEIVLSADGKYAFVSLGESSNIFAIDIQTKKIAKFIKVDLFPTNVWAGSDGMIYVENKNRKSVNVVDTKELFTTEFIDTPFKPGHIAYNKLLNELWICQAGENKVAYYERKNNEWVYKNSITVGDDAHAIHFTKDNKTAYVVNQKGDSVSMIDVPNHLKIKDIIVGKKPNGMVLVD